MYAKPGGTAEVNWRFCPSDYWDKSVLFLSRKKEKEIRTMEDSKKTLFSGMQATGNLTLGNYLGALKNWEVALV